MTTAEAQREMTAVSALDPRAQCLSLFEAALGVALPKGRFEPLPEPPEDGGRALVLGAGKAAASMALAFEAAWRARYPDVALEGLVITRYGHEAALEAGQPPSQIQQSLAAHPVPDEAGLAATQALMARAEAAGPKDLVVFLLSGGASALLVAPAEGVSLAEKQAVGKALLKAGANIEAMNAVRQTLSAVKGGRLAALVAPVRLVTYAISDVPGDVPAVIGSGPTSPALSDAEGALALCARFGIDLDLKLQAAMRSNPSPTVEAGDFRMIATPQMALEAAAQRAKEQGLDPMILSDCVEGEAREVAQVMASLAKQVQRHGQPLAAPCVLLSGGETTVTVRGQGRGGRNAEYLLALAIALDGLAGVTALACDTDGIDGIEDNAGAIIDPTTLSRAQALGLDARAYLDNNDAYSFFEALGDLVLTGPTLTNVNDFRAIVITPS